MAALVQYPNSLIEIHETWLKQSFRNRFTILSANGPLDLNIPVTRPNGNHTKTSEVQVSHHDNPMRKIKNAVESAYKSSPYFEFFSDALNAFFDEKYTTILEMNTASIQCMGTMLQHHFELNFTEDFQNPDDAFAEIIDLRYELSPKNEEFNLYQAPSYYQVFNSKFGFVSNLSILDLVMNMGTETLLYLHAYPLDHFIQTILKKSQ